MTKWVPHLASYCQSAGNPQPMKQISKMYPKDLQESFRTNVSRFTYIIPPSLSLSTTEDSSPSADNSTSACGQSVCKTGDGSAEFMKEQADMQRERGARLQEVCEKELYNLDHHESVASPHHFIVDDTYKLLYCFVPKVACTSWKRVFLVLNGVMDHPDDLPQNVVNNVVGPRKLHFLSSYSFGEQMKILENHTKFLVARHPFQRILSAFNNKLAPGSTSGSALSFQNRIGTYIMSHYRGNDASNATLYQDGIQTSSKVIRHRGQELKYDLRFEEFVKFLTNETDSSMSRHNVHWKEIHKMCSPCQIRYDVISHFESLETDARYILGLSHADHIVSFPSSKGSSPTNSSSVSVYESYFSHVPHHDLQKLYQRYQLDFDFFGYAKPDFLD